MPIRIIPGFGYQSSQTNHEKKKRPQLSKGNGTNGKRLTVTLSQPLGAFSVSDEAQDPDYRLVRHPVSEQQSNRDQFWGYRVNPAIAISVPETQNRPSNHQAGHCVSIQDADREGVRDRMGSNDEWLVGPAEGNYQPLQRMQDTRAARCIESTTKSNRPQTRPQTIDHRPLHSTIAIIVSSSLCLSIPFSLFYPLPLPCA